MTQPPSYPEEAVAPMRKELTVVGFKELKTAEEVDKAIRESKGVSLVMINSVCGCAAGSARPGVALALQNDKIPDHLFTVFAGMEKDAVDSVRALHEGYPPSSPAMAFFHDGKLAQMIQRSDIETRDPKTLAGLLVNLFNEHCTKQGPSIPKEEYSKLSHAKICGSQIPKISGGF